MSEGITDRRTHPAERRAKAILTSLFAGLLVVLFLTVSIYRDIRALSRDTRERAAASQQRWEQRRTDDEKRDKVLHDEILGELTTLTAELRVQRRAIERLNGVTPVRAIRDRAAIGARGAQR